MGRVVQLLPKVELYPANVQAQQADVSLVDGASRARLFDEEDLQNLWKQGVSADKDWRRARNSVK